MKCRGDTTVKLRTKIQLVTVLGLATAALVSCNDDRDEAAHAPVAAEAVKADAVGKANDGQVGIENPRSKVPKKQSLQKLPDGERTWARAIAKASSKSHLEEFDVNLKSILGISNLEEYEIGCVEGCDKFSTPDPLSRTVYVFPREYPDVLSRFAHAWDTTQRAGAQTDPGFKLELDPNVPPPICTGTANPAPCSSMPFCASDACGRKPVSSSSCSAC
jgi:hypothetical protein